MREGKYNLLNEKLSGKYADIDTLLDKVNNQIKSGKIQVDKDSLQSPMVCLNWGLTYKIYDCLYDINEPLTPAQIASRVDYEKKVYEKEIIVNHTLEYMSRIGITRPINHENLTSADVPIRGFSISSILYQVKKWELTESMKR